MTQATRDIPFCKQAAPKMCGAAALDMVYQSLGIRSSQDELWASVTGGHTCARTFLIGADCVRRGLAAVVVQSQQPWRHLQQTCTDDLRVILNHRPVVKAVTGHYTVLVDVDEQQAVIHDPQFGPRRREMRQTLLDLWLPSAPISEITGNVLVAISPAPAAPVECRTCGTRIPAEFECRRCHKPFPLAPAEGLGCLRSDCAERLWRRVFCPFCDAAYTELLPASQRSAMAAEPLPRVPVGPAGGKTLPQMLVEYAELVEQSVPLAATDEARQFLVKLAADAREAAVELPRLALEEARRATDAIRRMKKRLAEIPGEVRQRYEQRMEETRRRSPASPTSADAIDPDSLADALLARTSPANPESSASTSNPDE